ncbi:hypothetical protein [Blastococcus sp. SYSU D00695]
MPARARTALLTATALATGAALAACTTSVDGTPEERPTGPLTQVLGEADIEEVVGNPPFPIDVVAHPDGHLTALIGPESRTNVVDTFLVDLVPGPDGLATGNVRELPTLDWFADLHLTDDGTVVITGIVEKGPEYGPRILVLPPGADEPEVIDPDLNADYLASALSPDGSTVYVDPIIDSTVPRVGQLLAVDLATGETTGSVDLPVGGRALGLDVTADGTLTVLLGIRTPDDVYSSRLVTFDADLRQLSDTELRPAEETVAGALSLTRDGSAVVTVEPLRPGPGATVLRVADGAVTELAALDEAEQAPRAVAVDAAGQYAYLPHETDDGAAVVSVLELATGEVTTVDLCEDGGYGFDTAALTPDGASLAVLGSCDAARDVAVLVGRS